ncbi:MAG: hypothetical protein Q4C70_05430 [Planctomycetia bacterium]|nr:hypothetical protein [Planctomycetia bacterium]
MKKLNILETEDDYLEAIGYIDVYMDVPDDAMTQEELDYFNHLVRCIKSYESEHDPIPEPSEEDILEFRKEQEGL